jgi:hydroxymethylglutaryl-CoA lyase
MRERVHIREVGLRDGLQSIKTIMPTAEKLAWIKAEYDAGVSEIEVCSFVPPSVVPQMADAEAVARAALVESGLVVAALIPNLKGAERGISLGVHKLNYVVSVSESHNQANVRRSTAQSLEEFKRIASAVAAQPPERRPTLVGCCATGFGCTIEGAVSESRVLDVATAMAEAGAEEIVVADTVGYGAPSAIRRVFKALARSIEGIPLAAHFHDTRGLGVANTLAAFDVGVRAFDASLGGLGGCPFAPGATGNVVTEDVVFLFESMGVETGIDLDRLLQVRSLLARYLPNENLVGSVAKAGLPKMWPVATVSS